MKEELSYISTHIYDMDKTSYFIKDTKKIKFYFDSGKFVIEKEIGNSNNFVGLSKSIIRDITIDFILR